MVGIEKTTNKGKPTSKKCINCEQVKKSELFHSNASLKDGLNSYCKRCMLDKSLSSRGIATELTPSEESLLYKYFPFAHQSTRIICKKPDGSDVHESKPYSFADIAKKEGVSFTEIQAIFYKFTRLRLTTMIVKADSEGLIVTNIVYLTDNIRSYME